MGMAKNIQLCLLWKENAHAMVSSPSFCYYRLPWVLKLCMRACYSGPWLLCCPYKHGNMIHYKSVPSVVGDEMKYWTEKKPNLWTPKTPFLDPHPRGWILLRALLDWYFTHCKNWASLPYKSKLMNVTIVTTFVHLHLINFAYTYYDWVS